MINFIESKGVQIENKRKIKSQKKCYKNPWTRNKS